MSVEVDEYQVLFDEINTTLDYSLDTENITIGLGPDDLIGIATIANHVHRNDILHIIRDTAIEQNSASEDSKDTQLYAAIGKIISCILYVNRDLTIEELPAVNQKDFNLYMAHKSALG